MSDWVSTYGWYPDFHHITYLEWFQMWLNIPRIRLQQAVANKIGAELAHSTHPIQSDLAEALSQLPEEIRAVQEDQNRVRRESNTLSRYGL